MWKKIPTCANPALVTYLMANICEKATSILTRNSNLGPSYLITTVCNKQAWKKLGKILAKRLGSFLDPWIGVETWYVVF